MCHARRRVLREGSCGSEQAPGVFSAVDATAFAPTLLPCLGQALHGRAVGVQPPGQLPRRGGLLAGGLRLRQAGRCKGAAFVFALADDSTSLHAHAPPSPAPPLLPAPPSQHPQPCPARAPHTTSLSPVPPSCPRSAARLHLGAAGAGGGRGRGRHRGNHRQRDEAQVGPHGALALHAAAAAGLPAPSLPTAPAYGLRPMPATCTTNDALHAVLCCAPQVHHARAPLQRARVGAVQAGHGRGVPRYRCPVPRCYCCCFLAAPLVAPPCPSSTCASLHAVPQIVPFMHWLKSGGGTAAAVAAADKPEGFRL